MSNYYLMRSPKSLISDNRIGYGWQQVDFSQCCNEQELLEKRNYGRRTKQVKRFFNLKAGDIVLVPRHCSVIIGVVSGEKHFVENAPKNTWNQVSVNFKKENGSLRVISTRANLITNKLLSRLRLRMTIANLNKFGDEIRNLMEIAEAEDNDVANIYNDLEERRAEELKKSLKIRLESGNGLRIKGGGDGFEELICELLQLDGFNTKILSKKSNKGSGDIDIEATKELFFGMDITLYIQAKHHHGKTSGKALQQVVIASENGETEGKREKEKVSVTMVISTAMFSDAVEAKADEKGVTLIDGEEFIDWLYNKLPYLSSKTLYGLGVSNTPTLLDAN